MILKLTTKQFNDLIWDAYHAGRTGLDIKETQSLLLEDAKSLNKEYENINNP